VIHEDRPVAPVVAVARSRRPQDYLESIRRAGGDPWLLDPRADRPLDVVGRASALVLTGGGDVDARLYGEAPHPAFSAAEDGRDAFEIELVVRAIESDLPLLAICRGAQVLNVAAGGTLVQHIPDAVPQPAEHDVATPADAIAHVVAVSADTLLARILSPSDPGAAVRVAVNSRHHQAVKRPGHDLLVSATAPDGVIEAIERPASRFCLGVQWHPENFWRSGGFAALFEALLASAGRQAAERVSGR